MSEEPLNTEAPEDDVTSDSEEVTPAAPPKPKSRRRQSKRTAASAPSSAGADTNDDEAPHADAPGDHSTYGALREDNRVVMRHTIALNLESFRSSSVDFVEPRAARVYPAFAESAPPFFSVVIANHDGERHLPVVLDALRTQSFRDFEVVVVDDASRDDSVIIVERDYPEVRLIVNRANVGFAVTCNTGADAASGRYLVMLNSDTQPDPRWLEALALACVQNPHAASVASKMLLFDRRSVLHTTGDQMGRDGIARNRGAWQPDNGQYDTARVVFSACGGAAAYRRDLWQALGGFDEHFWMYMEDVDYGFRAQLAGFGSVYAPDARVYHHLSASSSDVLASYYVGRNALWVIAKNMPAGLLRSNWAAIVGGQLRIAGDALRAIQGKAARARLQGQITGLLGLGVALSQRKRIQAARRLREADLALLLE